jgi:hypothetical protein
MATGDGLEYWLKTQEGGHQVHLDPTQAVFFNGDHGIQENQSHLEEANKVLKQHCHCRSFNIQDSKWNAIHPPPLQPRMEVQVCLEPH